MNCVQEAVNTAYNLFGKQSTKVSEDSLQLMVNKIDQLSSEELGCKKEHIKHFPHIFTKLIENDQFQFSIFYIKKGYQLPLHDHPDMHGIIKVLFGQIRIHSYTATNIDSEVIRAPNEKYTVLCERADDCVLCSDDKPLSLTPYMNNIHEVIADTDTAFFDCLLPPYKEKCNFYRYKGVKDEEKNLYELLNLGSEPEISYYTVARTYSGKNFSQQS